MKKFTGKLLIAGFASLLFVTPVLAEPSSEELKEDKKKVEKEIDSLQDKLSDILKKMGDLEEDLIEVGEEVIQATEDLDEAKRIEQEQYEAMKLRIKFMYERGDVTYAQLLFESRSISDMMNKADYIEKLYEYDRIGKILPKRKRKGSVRKTGVVLYSASGISYENFRKLFGRI